MRLPKMNFTGTDHRWVFCLSFCFYCLLQFVVGYRFNEDIVQCYQTPVTTGCIRGYDRWFYTRSSNKCYRLFVCDCGFRFRTDCERICFTRLSLPKEPVKRERKIEETEIETETEENQTPTISPFVSSPGPEAENGTK
ncbi:uncharacterized protein LOC111074241 [Drosophila obscura]|uniref:uncharacterized protein LOC111074241 n=1 Tax=Drosophila obscura TaxID=7282 RepID=UPI000BA17212|nr:uncharacterized protein LOC111074241 [Drosophila obscura]